MDDDPYVSGTAAGILTYYVDLQRQFPGRFVGVVDTSDDSFLAIRALDTQTDHFLRVYAPADGVGTIILYDTIFTPVEPIDPFQTVAFDGDVFIFNTESYAPPSSVYDLFDNYNLSGGGGYGDGFGFGFGIGSGFDFGGWDSFGGGGGGGSDGRGSGGGSLFDSVDWLRWEVGQILG
jgi:hypothetical protein